MAVRTVLVIGANGNVGSALVPLLEQAGHTVRRGTRHAPEHDTQVHVQVNLLSGEGIAEALEGVQAAFLMAPPGHTNQDELLVPVIEAARQHHVEKLVLMSAMGADADESAPLRRVERVLEQAGLRYNIIRPNWFMQNFETFWGQPIREQGQILLPTGNAKGSFIDARDIAAVAAVLLTSSRFDDQAFDLTGSEALDHHEVAAILSDVTGRRIEYVDVPPDALCTPLRQAGLSGDYVEFLLLILSYFKLGYAARITEAVQQITGHAPRRFADYARERRGQFN